MILRFWLELGDRAAELPDGHIVRRIEKMTTSGYILRTLLILVTSENSIALKTQDVAGLLGKTFGQREQSICG